jgi:hypothetical protein
VSSEGVAPTLGLSGSVPMRALLVRAVPVGVERWTDLSPLAGLLYHAHSHSDGCSARLSR